MPQSPSTIPTDQTSGGLSHRQVLIILSGLMLGMLLAALDQTIVATALPTIVGDLHGLNHLSWVVTAYLLTTTLSTPLYGKISDLYGRKKIFQIAIVIFLVGSALSGLSANMDQLIAFRAVQGLGGGGLMALAMAIVGDIVSPPRARPLPGVLRCRLRGRQLRRPAGGRIPHRPSHVAVDLLHQHSRGDPGAGHHERRAPPAPAPGAGRCRPARRHARRGGGDPAHPRDRVGRYHLRLGLGAPSSGSWPARWP